LSNQVAFYPFILTNDVLYIVQITIAALHEIKEGIVDFFLQPALHSTLQSLEWRFVFIVPLGKRPFVPNQAAPG